MNYLLPGVRQAWQQALKDAGIDFKRTRIEKTNGLLVSADDFLRAIETIGMEIDESREPLTPRTDVTIMWLKAVEKPIEATVAEQQVETNMPVLLVTVDNVSIAQRMLTWMAPYLEERLDQIGKPIVIHGPIDGIQEPRTDGQFHIWIFASSKSGRSQRVPAYWRRNDTHCEGRIAFAPSGDGIALKSDHEAYVVGELVQRDNLYIHHDLGRCGCSNERELFQEVFELAISKRDLTEDERAAAEHHKLHKPKKVFLKNWKRGSDDLDEGFVRQVTAEILMPVINRDIVVTGRTGATYAPTPSPEQFQIRFWSAPDGRVIVDNPPTAWGIPVKAPNGSFVPSGIGISIVDPETCWAAAELLDDYLYILHDLSYYPGKDGERILRKIYEETVKVWQLTPDERAARVEAGKAAKREAARQTYLRKCMEGHTDLVRNQEVRVKNGRQAVEKVRRQLTEQIRKTMSDELLLNAMRKIDDSRAFYEREYDNLFAIDEVADVQMDNGALHIYTNTIYCTDPRDQKVHELGKYRIEIHLDGNIRWFNLAGAKRGHLGNSFQAPHVRENGEGCLGEMTHVFPELIARYELSVAAQLAIAFLQNVNVTDPNEQWGPANILSWPVVETLATTQA